MSKVFVMMICIEKYDGDKINKYKASNLIFNHINKDNVKKIVCLYE